ncbi:hypothetical protein AB1Y20_022235 [Prymnesium parvum]|uniref:DUF726 domain-containing protein n=1 Tax=Prymnesium parvum TaxID=97485 RepID=A0AB34JFL9_PRYPA
MLLAAALLLRCPPLLPSPRAPPPLSIATGAYAPDDDWPSAAQQSRPPPAANRWQRIGDCDVLLPDEGVPCAGLIHFVGGAMVGAAPLQAYRPFLEGLGAGGGSALGVVATPVGGLSGLDHWQAATEVMLRWAAARRALDHALFLRGDPSTDTLPVVGVGHSLGAKLLLLLGSDRRMCDALGPPRVANALLSYNSAPAAAAAPALAEAAALADAARRGGLAAVGAVGGEAARAVGAVRGGEAMGAALASWTAAAAAAARGGGAAAPAADFSPSAEETETLILSSYAVRRNLVVRFADDAIDQSSGLARLLQRRFTDATHGIGGRLDFKRLDGTHATPNAPSVGELLDGVDWGLAAQLGVEAAARKAVEGARRAEREREAACAVIVEFLERECARAV